MFIKCWLQFTGPKPQSPWFHAKHHIVPNELFANADQLTVAETFETQTLQGTKTHQQKLGTTTNNSGLEFGRAIVFTARRAIESLFYVFQIILDSWQAFDQVKRDALHETLPIGFIFGITTNLAKYLANTAQAGKHDCFTGVDNLVVTLMSITHGD